MATVTETSRLLFAHCLNPMCAGYQQQEVNGLVQESSVSYFESGGDVPGIEKSTVDLLFAKKTDRECPSCGRDRELSSEPRPSYQPLSGFDPNGLINGTVPAYDPSVKNTEADAAIAEMEARYAKKFAELEAKLGEKAA